MAIQPRYVFASPFSDSRAAVCDGCREIAVGEHHSVEGGRWGFIDRTGTLVIPIQYEEVASFAAGTARVKLNGEWRYINQKGESKRVAPLPDK